MALHKNCWNHAVTVNMAHFPYFLQGSKDLNLNQAVLIIEVVALLAFDVIRISPAALELFNLGLGNLQLDFFLQHGLFHDLASIPALFQLSSQILDLLHHGVHSFLHVFLLELKPIECADCQLDQSHVWAALIKRSFKEPWVVVLGVVQVFQQSRPQQGNG